MSTAKTPKHPQSEAEVLMKRTNFFLPEELHQGLKKAKEELGGSEGEHVRKAVTSYLKRHKFLAAA